MTPTTSIVKGSYFVFTNPLMYRRFMEEKHLEKKFVKTDDNIIETEIV